MLKNRLKMERKAMVLPEILKLFIALIAILILLYLAYQLYGIFTAKSDLEKARETLNQITGKIESLKESDEVEYLVTAPKGWYLVSYTGEESSPEKNYEVKALQNNLGWKFNMPSTCKKEGCLCMCKHTEDLTEIFDRHPFSNIYAHQTAQALIKYFFYLDIKSPVGISLTGFKSCENQGLCVDAKDVIVDNTISYSIHFKGEGETNLVRWISLHKVPQKIFLKKYEGSDEIFITKIK
jgi:hypothetical protein